MRQPTATTAFTPPSFSLAASSIASIDSCLAASMKPQVLTRITSAAGRSGVTTAPWPTSSPTSRSESTVALSQPREMTPSFIRPPVVPEPELDAEILGAQECDDFLELVLGGSRDADLFALNRGLGFLEFLVLDRLHNRLCFFLRDPLGELDLAPHGVVRRRSDRAELHVFHRHAALDHFRLQDVEQRFHLEVVIRNQSQRGLGTIKTQRRLRAFEVVALDDFFRGLIDGVVDFLKIRAGRNIK